VFTSTVRIIVLADDSPAPPPVPPKEVSPYPLGPLDPFLISPSGDPYWSHPENVQALTSSIEQFKQGRYVEKSMAELEAMANG
jgi:hypothetical protein